MTISFEMDEEELKDLFENNEVKYSKKKAKELQDELEYNSEDIQITLEENFEEIVRENIHEYLNKGGTGMEEFATVRGLVECMEENEMLAYISQPVVVDVIENFLLKKFNRSQLLDWPLNLLEDSIKRMYINFYPESAGD